jgi:hypothetical protein
MKILCKFTYYAHHYSEERIALQVGAMTYSLYVNICTIDTSTHAVNWAQGFWHVACIYILVYVQYVFPHPQLVR